MTQKPNYSFAITICIEFLNRLAHKAAGEGKDGYALALRAGADSLWNEREALAAQTRAAFGDECDPKPWNWQQEAHV